MNVIITPHTLQGTVEAPSSKSIGHRDLICAALAEGESLVDNISLSQDIEATCDILRALGAAITPVVSPHPRTGCLSRPRRLEASGSAAGRRCQ